MILLSVSLIRGFRNLVNLSAEIYCHDEDDKGRWVFELNNNNVTELGVSSPWARLSPAFLRFPPIVLGWRNRRSTSGPQRLLMASRTSRRSPDSNNYARPPGTHLRVWMSIEYHSPSTRPVLKFETVANGMIDIFPSLTHCEGLDQSWDELSDRITDLQEE